MNDLIQKIIELITGENGSIFFHILLLIPVALTAQLAWLNRDVFTDSARKRLAIGWSAVIALQMIILGTTALFFPVSPRGQLFPAILERFTTLSILIILLWLWLNDGKRRIRDIVPISFLVLSFILLLATFFSQNESTIIQSYNGSWFDFIWQVFSFVTALIGVIALIMIKPKGWGIMFYIAGTQLAGFLLHITLTGANGDFSTLVRLSLLATYPVIPSVFLYTLPKTQTIESEIPAVPMVQPSEPTAQPVPQIKKVPTLDYPLLHLWTSILEEEKPEKILISVCSALAHTLKADLCFIISAESQQKELLLQGGFDLIREVEKAGGTIKKSKLPKITKALENGENLQLTIEEEESEDVQTLRTQLSLDSEMNLLLLPMPSHSSIKSAVLLLSPYSKRIWSKEEQHQIEPINRNISILFEHITERIKTSFQNEQYVDQISELEAANQDWRRQFEEKEQELVKQQQEAESIQRQMEVLDEKMRGMVEKTQYEKIAVRHQQNQVELERLQNNNEELRQQLEELKNALIDFDPQESISSLSKNEGSSEVESMLAIQLESQEVINRLHEENQSLQEELQALSTKQDNGDEIPMQPVPVSTLFEAKKILWLDRVEKEKNQQNRQSLASLASQFEQLVQQLTEWDQNRSKRKTTGMLESWKLRAESIQRTLVHDVIHESQITFPELLDEIFESLNETVMDQDLTLKVDIPEGMNDVPVPDHLITHMLKTLLQDLVQSLQQNGWLSIKIEKQFSAISIHVSLSCSKEIQAVIMDILNNHPLAAEHFENHFGLLLTKDLVQDMQGIIESTQNTSEQTNLFIRLPINEAD